MKKIALFFIIFSYLPSNSLLMVKTAARDKKKTITKTLGAIIKDGNPEILTISTIVIPHEKPLRCQFFEQYIVAPHFAPIAAALKPCIDDIQNKEKNLVLWLTLQGLGFPPKEYNVNEEKDE